MVKTTGWYSFNDWSEHIGNDISIKLLQKQAKDQATDHHKSSQGSLLRDRFHLSSLSTCTFNRAKPFSPWGLCTCLPHKGQPSPAWGGGLCLTVRASASHPSHS